MEKEDIEQVVEEKIIAKFKEIAGEKGGSFIDWMPAMIGSPGIVIDESVAKATPCTCYRIDETEMCFSRGIIGTLSPAQREAYCVAGKTFKEEGITRRVKKFKEAATICKAEIEKYPKGERLEPWLACMGREARKRGIPL